ncbi:uncharacterized protein LOC129398317 [Pan paniscus]|uniref:uncharacterized protein LOC129398317 n=1 Tax=Pan paniscus TaxID=9597 RepID=UPI002436A3EF|nr:uncharacterized protein LOC129398317 [Pan paniscus]
MGRGRIKVSPLTASSLSETELPPQPAADHICLKDPRAPPLPPISLRGDAGRKGVFPCLWQKRREFRPSPPLKSGEPVLSELCFNVAATDHLRLPPQKTKQTSGRTQEVQEANSGTQKGTTKFCLNVRVPLEEPRASTGRKPWSKEWSQPNTGPSGLQSQARTQLLSIRALRAAPGALSNQRRLCGNCPLGGQGSLPLYGGVFSFRTRGAPRLVSVAPSGFLREAPRDSAIASVDLGPAGTGRSLGKMSGQHRRQPRLPEPCAILERVWGQLVPDQHPGPVPAGLPLEHFLACLPARPCLAMAMVTVVLAAPLSSGLIYPTDILTSPPGCFEARAATPANLLQCHL